MKPTRHFLHLVSLAAVSLFAAGCFTVTDDGAPSSPFGPDVSLDGLWDVNGAAPTVASCGDIATVRVVVCWDATAAECFTTQSLTFACADGEFDTRPGRVLAAGSYYSLWEALDSAGNLLQETDPLPLVVTTGGHATLATPDFEGALEATTLRVQVRFEDVASGPFVTCSAANIASNQFTYTLHEGSNALAPVIAGPSQQLCTAGSDVLFTENPNFQFDDMPYTLVVRAQETVGSCTSIWQADCTFTLNLNTANVVTCNATVSSGPGC